MCWSVNVFSSLRISYSNQQQQKTKRHWSINTLYCSHAYTLFSLSLIKKLFIFFLPKYQIYNTYHMHLSNENPNSLWSRYIFEVRTMYLRWKPQTNVFFSAQIQYARHFYNTPKIEWKLVWHWVFSFFFHSSTDMWMYRIHVITCWYVKCKSMEYYAFDTLLWIFMYITKSNHINSP